MKSPPDSYHIFFHDDIDGIVSAAIIMHKLVRGADYRLYPIMSSNRGEKFKQIINELNLGENDFLAILDYEYHQRANLWIDHHFNQKFGDQKVCNEQIIYDPIAPSATSLAMTIPSKNKIHNESFIQKVNTIDTAGYKTVDEIFSDTHPLMLLRAYVELAFPSEMMYSRAVEVISNSEFDLRKAIYALKIDNSCYSEIKKALEVSKKFMTIFNNFSFITQKRANQFPRYAEFYLNKTIKYAVRISKIQSKKTMYLQVQYNRWHQEPNRINVGQMLSKFKYLLSGGGHYSVGGGIVLDKDIDRLLDDLNIHLNPESEVEMEKYGVDKNDDSVEKEAIELIKTGAAKSIDEARKMAVQKGESRKDAVGRQE